MRVVPRESLPETKLLKLAGSDRSVEVEAVIDANGQVKVNRVIDVDSGKVTLTKPIGRFVILDVSRVPSRRHLS